METQSQVVPTPLSCESDYEFWEDLERRPVLKAPKTTQVEVKILRSPPPELAKPEVKPTQQPLPPTAKQISPEPPQAVSQTPTPQSMVSSTSQLQSVLSPPDSPHSRRLEDSIPIRPRSPTTKVSDGQERVWQAKYDALLAESKQLQVEALRCRSLLFDQETELAQLRARMRTSHEASRPTQTVITSPDTNVLETQVAAFTDLLEYYEQQTQSSKEAKDRVTAELEGIRAVHATELAQLREEFQSREQQTQAECERLQQE